MCFSATASFTTATILLPLGAYALLRTRRVKSPYWLFALYPLAFALQQAAEGWLWLALETRDPLATRTPALVFMFFSHLFWLFWVPFSTAMIEAQNSRRRLFFAISIVGALYGLSMYIPAVLYPDWLTLRLHERSIVYDVRLFYDQEVPRLLVRALYAVLVLLPLLASTHKEVRRFGVLIFVSVVIAYVYFAETFVSVWCYFAAVISIYVFFMLKQLNQSQQTTPL